MPITFPLTAQYGVDSTGAATSVTANYPPSVATGDVLIAHATCQQASSINITWTAGASGAWGTWVGPACHNDAMTSSQHFHDWYMIVLDHTLLPATSTFSSNRSGDYTLTITGARGVNQLIPVDNHGPNGSDASAANNNTAVTIPGHNVTKTDSMLIASLGIRNSPTVTWGSGITALSYVASANVTTNSRSAGALGYLQLTGPGDYPTMTATISSARDWRSSSWSLALEAASADAGEPQIVVPGQRVIMDGSDSQLADTYLWEQDPTDLVQVIMKNADTAVMEFDAPKPSGITPLVLDFTLTTNEGEVDESSDGTSVTVNPAGTSGGIMIKVWDGSAWS